MQAEDVAKASFEELKLYELYYAATAVSATIIFDVFLLLLLAAAYTTHSVYA